MNKKQLFCFTYAGGNASFFNVIENDLPEIEFVKFEYSGHGLRHKEVLYSDFDELTDDIFCEFKRTYKRGNYALFGYSMGTITLVEILKRITNEPNMVLPSRVFMAAHEPHSKTELTGFTADEMDEWVKQRTICFGAVPEKLINNKSFWRLYLPLYRADYSIIGKYKFEDLDLKSEVPATVFYSEIDTPLIEMKKWKKYFVGECDFFEFKGNHFFIQEYHQDMAKIIYNRLCK